MKKAEKANQNIANLTVENEKLKREVNTLHKKVTQLESQSRRDNQICERISKDNDETWQNCEDKLSKISERNLDLRNLEFERVHRLGKPGRTTPCYS